MRRSLIRQLEAYRGEEAENTYLTGIVSLLVREERCFHRDFFKPGHITGSGLLVSHDGLRIALNHHKSLNIWVCFGGHADGEEDILSVARREVAEESGVRDFHCVSDGIFDIDIHSIPENPKKKEPQHQHFDITFLFQTTRPAELVVSDESHNIRWCSLEEAQELSPSGRDHHMDRLFRKWQAWRSASPDKLSVS